MHIDLLPKPILFHPLKHHLGYIREFAQATAQLLPEQELMRAFRRIGGSQLDLYIGPLSPVQISEEVILYLQQQKVQGPEDFRSFLAPAGYRICTLSDRSAWALRWGVQQGRHVHLHPGRYALHTLRVKANHLKTALAVSIASIKYKRSANLQLLNQVRGQWLGLSPVPGYTSDDGLGKVLELVLRQA
ncbi:hypothetical protein [Pontibacter mangrovi]|uniref:Uncharacterized protein n=1 Tax=Pontibacter mangrovi TaxID=2589816 RepID=A0A501WCQ4_9BACT|nr:hypothetical protein [Pontibacter mangrovi]TPE45001.1 hypothetical protein FJM65_08295 [Pontibacter mangrovi]